MFDWLKRFNIIQISVFSLTLFVILVIVLSTFSISSVSSRYQAAKDDINLLELVAALEQVAHHHAVERGLTAGYLASASNAGKQRLSAQRAKADQSEAGLNDILSQAWVAEYGLTKYALPLRGSLSDKARMRRQIDSLSAPNAFNFYSKVNRLAIDMAVFIKGNISEKTLRDAAKVTLLFAQYKERSGQVRGMINGALSRQSVNEQLKVKLNTYFEDIEITSIYLDSALPEAMRSDFANIVNSSTNQQIKSVSGRLMTDLELDFNQFPQPSEWFANATQHISEVKSLLEAQITLAKQSGKETEDSAYRMLLFFVIGVFSVVSIIILLNLYLVRNLRVELKELTHTLSKVAKEGDLTMDVRLDSKDELGFISNAIHTTIYAFKDLITGLATSIEVNRGLNEKMGAAHKGVENSVQATEALAINIASSINEMSAASDEIANSASLTLESCVGLNQSVEATSESNQKTRTSMEKLAAEMQGVESNANDMESQLNAISGMLETINSVAEQTNLLALNAAIEAARAGEQGRGFAVVADEVRSLAQGSKKSSDQISQLLANLETVSAEMITSIRNNVNNANQTYEITVESETITQQLFEQASKVESMTTSVSAAVEEQSVVSKQIAEDAASVLASAQTEVEAVNQMKTLSSELDVNSETLERTMLGFKIK